ncbi:virulence RhuM family protein [Avibacterium sp. 21-599]|uniref:virulence RhuM family protein n=1 Tax=Avibacterium sp. 21-599 TaxID=2911528 RepID=UPI002245576A|nr:virulence RhuM family protein [Avibacterium sp. 21-599]MCW9717760.1 virulence RhuM family protein [Avibacterium sp. 21-599]
MSEMILYTAADGGIQIKVTLEDETVWLTLDQMAQLFGRDKSTISRHIKNIFEEGELQRDSVVANFATTASDGKTYQVEHYNLDVIISVGYRVKSLQGTHFRQWAAARLKEYLIKGFTMDDERLKNLGGGSYWKELLTRIKDIRSSEKVMYRQVLDLYATATDYDPQSDISKQFFQTVQNKLHYAAHGHTASEVIYYRVDSDKPFAGLTHFKGAQPTQAEAMIAKNFLEEKELRILNNLVAAYFDLAELNALEEREMRMADFLRELDTILASTGRKVLENAGKISSARAQEKAKAELRKYKAKTLSPVEEDYLKEIKTLTQKTKKKQL